MDILTILVLLVVFLIALVMFSLFRKPPQVTGIDNLSEALTNVRIELKGLSEKTRGVEQHQTQVSQGISSFTVELVRADAQEIKAMSERVEKVERTQSQANQDPFLLGSGLAKTDVLTRSLAEAAEVINSSCPTPKVILPLFKLL